MLQLTDIAKQYKTADLVQNALDGVTLSLRDREFVAILGPSGSGKTTLLNVIGGLDHYDSGDLIINGVSTKNYRDRDWDTYRNHSIGFVFQSYNLIPHQTVLANVELALTISGVPVSERKMRAKEALVRVGLEDHINKRPSQLSGGQMQRVAIARALVNDPEIVLADEPTGALDSETSVQVMDILQEVSKDRLVVMVTHNPELAEEYATRIVRIKDGKVVDDTDPYEPVVYSEAGPSATVPSAEGSDSAESPDSPEGSAPAPEAPAPVEVTRGGAKKGKYVKKKAAMSFLTALVLSFNNLRTKKTRTILVAIAGSIGIIGIALIQALSNGVNDYISEIEESTVSQYPISIDRTGINVAAYMSMLSELNQKTATDTDEVTINQVLHKYTSGLTNNDLRSLKAYLDNEEKLDEFTKAIEYTYELAPRVYRENNGEIRRIHPDEVLEMSGMRYEQVAAMNLISFYALPDDDILYLDQYNIKAGRWPEDENECVIVLGDDGSITDLCSYALGLKDSSDLDELIRKLVTGEDIALEENPGIFTYDDLMDSEFTVINACKFYTYDEDNNLWIDKSNNKEYVRRLYEEEGRLLKVVGIVKAKEDVNGLLTSGIYYTNDLVRSLVAEAAESDVVKAQQASRSVNILNGKEFGDMSEMDEVSLSDMLDINEDAIKEAFSFDIEDLGLDSFSFDNLEFDESALENLDLSNLNLEGLMDLGSLGLSLPMDDLQRMLDSIVFNVTADDFRSFFSSIMNDFVTGPGSVELNKIFAIQNSVEAYLKSDEAGEAIRRFVNEVVEDAVRRAGDDVENVWQYISISEEQLQQLGEELTQGFNLYFEGLELPDFDVLTQLFADYMSSDEMKQNLIDFVTIHLETEEATRIFYEITNNVSSDMQTQIQDLLTTVITAIMEELTKVISEQISTAMESAMNNISLDLEDVFSVDEQAIADAFSFNMSEDSIKDLLTTYANTGSTTYESNLLAMGYSDLDNPYSIDIYSKDFDSKAGIVSILDGYNERMKEEGEEDKVITYSDIAGTMMSSVSSIISVISTALIALVAISLVVSSIMIGVITYISVLERKKEIGILRALGASKRNVADVFNAETFITGLMAGLLGISVSALLTIFVNWLLAELAGQAEVRTYLDIRTAIFLVILSVVLNMLSGFLPSRKASKSNPVTALRDE